MSYKFCKGGVDSGNKVCTDKVLRTSNTTALTLNGNGNFNIGSQQLPPITNNAGSGVSGDIHLENDAACVGFIILKLRKVSGYNNIT